MLSVVNARNRRWLITILVVLVVAIIVVLALIPVYLRKNHSNTETEAPSNKCVPDKSKDKLSLATVALVNANESQFNDPNTSLVLRLSCSILNTSNYLITMDDIPSINNTNTTSGVTILDKTVNETMILSFIALDTYELPIVTSFDLYFGSISMPVRVLYPNESIAVGVSVRAYLTDAPNVGQSGYTNEQGIIVFTNIPFRTISLFAWTTNNQIAVAGIAPSASEVTLVFLAFGNVSLISKAILVDQQPQSSAEHFLRRIEKRDAQLPGFTVETFEQELRMTSRTFKTETDSTGVYVRYKFVTSEVPGGFFGSIFNDYFTVSIRSEKGHYETLSQSMNGLGLGAFNYSSGETNWYTLKLKVSQEPQLIQVDVGVANVGDGAYQSSVIVDQIGIERCEKCNDCDSCKSDPMCRDTCLNPPMKSCLFYTDCMEAKVTCGTSGYAIAYGSKYCQKYSNRLTLFTSEGQAWIHQTMNCLQKSLVAPLQNCENSCENLRATAFASHPSCYINSGVCNLSGNNWFQILTTVGNELLNNDGFIQALKTSEACLPTLVLRLKEEIVEATDVTKLKLSIILQWIESLLN